MQQGAGECGEVEYFLTLVERLDVDRADGNGFFFEGCDDLGQVGAAADEDCDAPGLGDDTAGLVADGLAVRGKRLCEPLAGDTGDFAAIAAGLQPAKLRGGERGWGVLLRAGAGDGVDVPDDSIRGGRCGEGRLRGFVRECIRFGATVLAGEDEWEIGVAASGSLR
jgi:hypothetical protein